VDHWCRLDGADGSGGEIFSTESVVRAIVSMGSATCTAGTKASMT